MAGYSRAYFGCFSGFFQPRLDYFFSESSRVSAAHVELVQDFGSLDPLAETSNRGRANQITMATQIEKAEVKRSGIGRAAEASSILEENVIQIKDYLKLLPNAKDLEKNVNGVGETIEKTSGKLETATNNVGKSVTNTASSLDKLVGSVTGFAGDIAGSALTVWGISETLKSNFGTLNSNVSTGFSQVNSVFNNSFKVGSTALGTSGDDGKFVSLFKNSLTTLLNPIRSIENIANAFKTNSDSLTTTGNDGNFTKVLKMSLKAIIDPLNAIKSMSDTFKISSQNLASTDSDGAFAQLLKTSLKAMIDPLGTIRNISEGFKISSDNLSPTSSDGVFTQLLKTSLKAMIDPLGTIRNISEGFKISSDNLSPTTSDGVFTKLLKNSLNTMISSLGTIKNISESFKINSEYLTSTSNEGLFTKVLKTSLKAIIDPIGSVSTLLKIGNSDALTSSSNDGLLAKLLKSGVSIFLNPMNKILNAIGDLTLPNVPSIDLPGALKGIEDLLKDMLDAVGANFGKVVDLLANFVNVLTQDLIGLFVPSQADFMKRFKEKFDDLSNLFKTKFALFNLFFTLFPQLLAKQAQFEDLYFPFKIGEQETALPIPLSKLNLLIHVRDVTTSLVVLTWVRIVYVRFYRRAKAVQE